MIKPQGTKIIQKQNTIRYLWSVVSNLILMMLMRNVTAVCLIFNCGVFYLWGSNVVLWRLCWFLDISIAVNILEIRSYILTSLLRAGLRSKTQFISFVVKGSSFVCCSWGWIMDLKVESVVEVYKEVLYQDTDRIGKVELLRCSGFGAFTVPTVILFVFNLRLMD